MSSGILRSTQVLLASLTLSLTCVFSAHGQIIIDPPVGNSTIPAMIRVVGRDALGGVDPSGEFTVTVRDLANNPVVGSQVRVTFSPCSNVRLCPSQGASVTGMSCDPVAPWVQGLTNANGQWIAAIAGCSREIAMPLDAQCVEIRADGVLLGFPRVSILDLSGCDGVGANDLSIWLSEFVAGHNLQRADYDGSGTVGANDLSLWLTAFGSAGSALNCAATACP